MALDEDLADRVREVVSLRESWSERKMFGGIAFMISGNMACGVSSGGEVIVRLGAEEAAQALTEPHVTHFDPTGKRMKSWVLVQAEGTASDEDLAGWVDVGCDYAASLPPK